MKRRMRIFFWVMIVAFLCLTSFSVWWLQPYTANAEARQALISSSSVKVSETGDYFVFMPIEASEVGLIFYPGGKVEATAYAEYMRKIAEAGYPVFLIKMPLNLAVFGVDRGAEVLKDYPQITTWAIGGHSLGGSMAGRFIQNHTQVKGLLLWASYVDVDLSTRADLLAYSIVGTNDKLATGEKIDSGKKFLPISAEYVTIEGGNHAMFGDYGTQTGDGSLTIDRTAAENQIIAASLKLLQALEG